VSQSTWIKICGIRTMPALEAAIASKVQAVGFVFAESSRQIAPTAAARIASHLPDSIASVAVFLRPQRRDINAVLEHFTPRYVQADANALAGIDLPHGIFPMPVFRQDVSERRATYPHCFVYEGEHSGAGQTVDWDHAAHVALHGDMVLAGGLTPDNVERAMNKVRPFGVDVSSGVEAAPGDKDPALIRRFAAQVRKVDWENTNADDSSG